MKNLLVAKILNEIADILEMQEVEFKPRAYRKGLRGWREIHPKWTYTKMAPQRLLLPLH